MKLLSALILTASTFAAFQPAPAPAWDYNTCYNLYHGVLAAMKSGNDAQYTKKYNEFKRSGCPTNMSFR